MANLRKLLAAAFSGTDLSTSDIQETAVDRIAAMAFTDRLGGELWRLQLSHDPRSYRRALALLTHRTKPIARDRAIRQRLCETVLREWLDTLCRHCAGRGFIMVEGSPKKACPVCDGTTLRRYSDQWRMARMGFAPEVYRKWESRFAAVHQKLANADAAAWRDIAANLGWLGAHVEQEILALHAERATIRSAKDGPDLSGMPIGSTTGAE